MLTSSVVNDIRKRLLTNMFEPCNVYLDAGYGNHESKGKFDFSYSQPRPSGNSSMNIPGYWGRSAFGPSSTFRALEQKVRDHIYLFGCAVTHTIQEEDDNDDDEEDDDNDNDDQVDVDDDDDDDGNDDEQADDDDDDDDDEFPAGGSKLTSQAARQHVFPILIAELVRENIIGKKEGSSIMDQFNSGNPVVRYCYYLNSPL